jgi:hypothetical protein
MALEDIALLIVVVAMLLEMALKWASLKWNFKMGQINN